MNWRNSKRVCLAKYFLHSSLSLLSEQPPAAPLDTTRGTWTWLFPRILFFRWRRACHPTDPCLPRNWQTVSVPEWYSEGLGGDRLSTALLGRNNSLYDDESSKSRDAADIFYLDTARVLSLYWKYTNCPSLPRLASKKETWTGMLDLDEVSLFIYNLYPDKFVKDEKHHTLPSGRDDSDSSWQRLTLLSFIASMAESIERQSMVLFI